MMDCREFERTIPDFVAKKLNYPTLKRFCEHMVQCDSCNEELIIQFLVIEGIQRLEDGDAFDLQRELKNRLLDAKRKIKMHERFIKVGIGLDIIAFCMLVGIVVWLFL